MRILRSLVQRPDGKRAVETAVVSEVKGARALLSTSTGKIWAHTALSLKAGDRVTFARAGSEAHVLSLSSSLSRGTKIVRV